MYIASKAHPRQASSIPDAVMVEAEKRLSAFSFIPIPAGYVAIVLDDVLAVVPREEAAELFETDNYPRAAAQARMAQVPPGTRLVFIGVESGLVTSLIRVKPLIDGGEA